MKDHRDLYDYNYFHQSRNFQTKPERTKILVEKIMEYNPKSVLDIGCGLGAVVNELNNMGVSAYGVDFAPDLIKIWGKTDKFGIADARKLPFDSKFDVVFSSDFFEHIDEEDIGQVASEMKRVGKQVVAFVADDTGRILNEKQKELHVTHKPLAWWKDRLKGIDVFSSHSAYDQT